MRVSSFESGVPHFPLKKYPTRSRSSAVMTGALNHVLMVWAGAAGRGNLHLMKSSNIPVDCCNDLDFKNVVVTNTCTRHCTPNHDWLWVFHTWPQATWVLFLPSLPPNPWTLTPEWKAHFNRKRRPWTTGQQSSPPPAWPGWLPALAWPEEPGMPCISRMHLIVLVLEAATPASSTLSGFLQDSWIFWLIIHWSPESSDD